MVMLIKVLLICNLKLSSFMRLYISWVVDGIHNYVTIIKKVTEMENNLKDKDDLIGDLVLRLKIVEDMQNTFEEEVDKVDHVIDIIVIHKHINRNILFLFPP